MRQRGRHRIPAAADAVWLALQDPEVLSQCIPGCQALTRVADHAFTATVKARVGDFTGLITAEITISDLYPPHAYAVEATFKGGAAGSGRGSARISLVEKGGETVVLHEVEGHLTGKLAQLDRRTTGAWARGMVDDFFARFSEIVAPGRAAARTPASRAPFILVVLALAALVVVLRRPAPRVILLPQP